LRKIEDHADIAFSASWRESKATCREDWADRAQSQKQGSFKKDEEILKLLIEQAPNRRERQRLERLKCVHAGAWISAVPSTHDGVDTVMRPKNFQVAISMRLGLPVLSEEKSCHCVCKPLMFLAIIQPAAQCLPIEFTVTTVFGTCWTEFVMRACCRP